MTLDLTPEEAAVLREVLVSFLSDLRMEVADTENYDMREDLKREEEIIKRVISRLEVPTTRLA